MAMAHDHFFLSIIFTLCLLGVTSLSRHETKEPLHHRPMHLHNGFITSGQIKGAHLVSPKEYDLGRYNDTL